MSDTVSGPELRAVGKNLEREDGADKATGAGMFATDMQLPNMLTAR